MTHAGLLHSDTCGSKSACDSPQLFAAYRVLLRPLMPRHSPCALCSLTIFGIMRSPTQEVVLFPLSRIDNLFEIAVFYPRLSSCALKHLNFFTSRIIFFFVQFSRSRLSLARKLQVSCETHRRRILFHSLPMKEAQLQKFSFAYFSFLQKKSMVGTSGLEPPTSRLSGVRSNHLSYAPMLLDPSVQVLSSCPLQLLFRSCWWR